MSANFYRKKNKFKALPLCIDMRSRYVCTRNSIFCKECVNSFLGISEKKAKIFLPFFSKRCAKDLGEKKVSRRIGKTYKINTKPRCSFFFSRYSRVFSHNRIRSTALKTKSLIQALARR